jgi:hypothetical protein
MRLRRSALPRLCFSTIGCAALTAPAQKDGDEKGYVGDALFPETCTRYTFRAFGVLTRGRSSQRSRLPRESDAALSIVPDLDEVDLSYTPAPLTSPLRSWWQRFGAALRNSTHPRACGRSPTDI